MIICAPAWGAAESDSSRWQMAIQAGAVLAHQDAGPLGTVTVSYSRWEFGGVWAEFGVLDPKQEGGRIALLGQETLSAFSDGWPPADHYVESSVGIMFGGVGEQSGYCRLGLGAYRFEGYSYYKHWLPGGSFALGVLIGPTQLHMKPMVEVRYHVTESPDPYDGNLNTLLSVSGGFWFR